MSTTIKFHVFNKGGKGCKLQGDECFIYHSCGKHNVTFSISVSNDMIAKDYTNVMIAEEVENETYYFVFNNHEGCVWPKRTERNKNIIVNNKELTTFLVEKLGLRGSEKYRVRLESEAVATKYGFRFKIIKP